MAINYPVRNTGDRILDQIQRESRDASNRTEGDLGTVAGKLRLIGPDNPATGELLKDVSLTSTPTDFAHTLGREPVGAILVLSDTAAVFMTPAVGDTPKSNVSLEVNVAGPVIANVWVF